MHRFFVDRDQIDVENHAAFIAGKDAGHIKNVLRMKEGEEVSLMIPGDEDEYRCAISAYEEDLVRLTLLFVKKCDAELPCEIVLYQALPKA
ncbi:MAG: 16S rRNA (uracil(1498)-N(3))-methyltransferase, partial [Lachnospiraceae bacterium]|nr:16S rRNA (uracil(1498)-N(3))-methyltransferase [Lachnospiraceae bacterium]